MELKYGDKNFKLDSTAYPQDMVINLFSFDSGQEWQGDGNVDDFSYFEKGNSILLESRDNLKKEAYILKKLDLSKYQIFQLAVNLQSDPSELESLRLYFSNKDKTAYFQYPLTNLAPGWNYLKIPKIKLSSSDRKTASPGASLNWNNIERIGIEMTSRFNSVATANFAALTGLQTDDYLDNWLSNSPLFMDLAKNKEGKTILQAKNVGTSMALIKKISGVSNFVLKAKVQPLKLSARSGLFVRGDYKTGYGYYFLIDGVNGNRWQIIKTGLDNKVSSTTILKNGAINNFAVELNRPLWLKAEVQGGSLKFHLSTDGKSYTLLGENSDAEFRSGGVGIAVLDGGVSQFDEIEFNQ